MEDGARAGGESIRFGGKGSFSSMFCDPFFLKVRRYPIISRFVSFPTQKSSLNGNGGK